PDVEPAHSRVLVSTAPLTRSTPAVNGTLLLEVVRPSDPLVPAGVAAEFTAFARQITARSDILREEHCSECAAPACYSTCAFFTPTADLTCRPFVAEIAPVVSPEPPILSRIQFRKFHRAADAIGARAEHHHRVLQ